MHLLLQLFLALMLASQLNGVPTKTFRTFCMDRYLEFCIPLGRQQTEGPPPSREGDFELRLGSNIDDNFSPVTPFATYNVKCTLPEAQENQRWMITLTCLGPMHDMQDSLPLLDLSIAMLRNTFNNSIDLLVKADKDLKQVLCLTTEEDKHTCSINCDAHVRMSYSEEYLQNTGEIIDWVSEQGESLAAVPRSYVHRYNLLHRGMGVLLFDKNERVFVHQRAASKRIFPSMFDMFIGGVSALGESSVQTLIRELQEEVGIDLTHKDSFEETAAAYLKNADTKSSIDLVKKLLRDSDMSESKQKEIEHMSEVITDSKSFSVGNTIKFLGKTKCYTSYNHCLVDIFAVELLDPTIADMAFKDGEVQFGEWLTLNELQNRLRRGDRDKFVPDGLQVWDELQKLLLF